ncbi:hypothetical protein BCL57_001543 [Agromyces flavus]|uniref:Methyl-accepting chemotaxis protein n=1 Tax=Agromyces flavus TaxID=589382 RepID=A0A1H2A1R8_9MICO|nr:DUF4391 domain-containing protein [Agromyces flavus]MCP2367389.1 hypothetical protein [Agromyces flavus]GGI45824.1 hypothetical protein GCM10010932_11520 [Agromyces flavus]SDT39975.1 protein of unknown function [Agromyces flavus]
MTEPVLFRWPANAALGRTVSKTKFYEYGTMRAALREKFVEEVQRITWAYKLADETLRLRGTPAVPEIQVFTVEAKGQNVSNDVLAAMDRAVHFPIIFEIESRGRVRTVAAQKSVVSKIPTIGAYFTTDWQPTDALRRPLPTTLDLAGLYEAILAALLPVETRAGETVSEATDRLGKARKVQREIAALERKLRTEPQLNRKIRLLRQIKEHTEALTALTDSAPSNKE